MTDFVEIQAFKVDFSVSGLRAAMRMLGPSFQYDVYLSPIQFMDDAALLRDWTRAQLAIQMNAHEDVTLEPRSWYVELAGRRVGSRGFL